MSNTNGAREDRSSRAGDTLIIHRFEPVSVANGPGRRAVLWVQGCGLGCPGCFNPETHAFDAGERWTSAEAVERVLAVKGIEGLTISGGEPAYQHRALATMLEELRAKRSLSVLVFSGLTWEELQRVPGIDRFLGLIDVLIAGRYDQTKRIAGGLIGSANKTVHYLTDRYTPEDLARVPQAEVIVDTNGEIRLSGIDPLEW